MKNIQDASAIQQTEADATIDRYLNGHMSEPESAAFEIRMMENPDLFRQVQLIDAMKKEFVQQHESLLAAQRTSASDLAPNLSERPETDGTEQSLPDNHLQLPILPFHLWVKQPFSLAATLLVAVLGFNAWQSIPQSVPAQNSAIGVNTLVLLEASRGATEAGATGAAPYLLQVDAGFDAGTRPYALDLADSSGQPLVSLRDLHADPDGWIRLVVNEDLNGPYQLTLQWTDDAGQPASSEFSFRIAP